MFRILRDVGTALLKLHKEKRHRQCEERRGRRPEKESLFTFLPELHGQGALAFRPFSLIVDRSSAVRSFSSSFARLPFGVGIDDEEEEEEEGEEEPDASRAYSW
jgi:hypothetical protein